MQYKLIKPKPLGERDEKYGQTFWSDTHDSDKPVMFNLMTGEVGDGAVISFEESVNKQSAKGTDYLRLRKVKVESTGQLSSEAPPNDTQKLLELIYENTNLILEQVSGVPKAPQKSLSEAWNETTKPKDVDVVVEDIDDGVDLSTIPF